MYVCMYVCIHGLLEYNVCFEHEHVCMHVVCVCMDMACCISRNTHAHIHTHTHTKICIYHSVCPCARFAAFALCFVTYIAWEQALAAGKSACMYIRMYVCMNACPVYVFRDIHRMGTNADSREICMYVYMYMHMYACMHVCMPGVCVS